MAPGSLYLDLDKSPWKGKSQRSEEVKKRERDVVDLDHTKEQKTVDKRERLDKSKDRAAMREEETCC